MYGTRCQAHHTTIDRVFSAVDRKRERMDYRVRLGSVPGIGYKGVVTLPLDLMENLLETFRCDAYGLGGKKVTVYYRGKEPAFLGPRVD